MAEDDGAISARALLLTARLLPALEDDDGTHSTEVTPVWSEYPELHEKQRLLPPQVAQCAGQS